jgi:S-DNA-T family DNA segregation ATPase FtsK/SpoIIIE
MASIPSDIEIQPAAKNTRVNEIVAIALIALALLLGLCLVSYHPNDLSWNAAGQVGASNWIGTVGANVSAALFQAIGLAAYLLPVLLLAVAWRRFRSRRINAPISQIAGLVVLVLSLSGLLSLANIRPFFDASFNAGGLSGAIITGALVAGLNTVGAAILLAAIAATGVLLATNFSFALFYENITVTLGNRFHALRLVPEKFRAWRQARRARRQERLEMHRQARADAATAVNAQSTEAIGTQIVSNEREGTHAGAADGDELAAAFESFTTAQKTMSAAAGAATAPAKPSSGLSRGKSTETAESAIVEEMVREAAVKRKTEAPATGALPFDGQRKVSPKTAASDYQLPSVDLLNEAQMRREQADDELLNMATKLAEKCREFNVTGQIKYICPGPVVTSVTTACTE